MGSVVRRYDLWYFPLAKEEAVKSSSGVNCTVSYIRYGYVMATKALKDGEDIKCSLQDGIETKST